MRGTASCVCLALWLPIVAWDLSGLTIAEWKVWRADSWTLIIVYLGAAGSLCNFVVEEAAGSGVVNMDLNGTPYVVCRLSSRNHLIQGSPLISS